MREIKRKESETELLKNINKGTVGIRVVMRPQMSQGERERGESGWGKRNREREKKKRERDTEKGRKDKKLTIKQRGRRGEETRR